jgi:C4-dicarboxylate-specific signal transduction histidine kinase
MFLLLIYRKRQIELIHYKQTNESRQRLSLALWGSGDSIWHWDINKNIIVRENFSRDNVSSVRTSFSIENLSEFIHPDDINRVKVNLTKAISGEVSLYQVDYRLKTAEDQWLWVLDRGQVNEYDENKKATDIVGTTQDISRLKEVQNELYQLNHDLEKRVQSRTHDIESSNKELEATIEQLNKTKNKLVQMEKMSALTNLVCGIAHEINTPLSIVKTSLSCIQEEDKALTEALESGKLSRDRFTKYKEKYPHANKLCTDNINRAIKLIDEFKRISIREKDYQFEKLNLSYLVDKLIKEYEADHSTSVVTFASSIPNDIFIHSSKQAIEDIFRELINNSLKHAFQLCLPDNNHITIELVEHNNEFTTLQYKDNGCGLDPETIAHVFEPFNCNCLGKEGLGLGLNMTYNIITSILEGEIQQVDINTGTSFKLTFKNSYSNI